MGRTAPVSAQRLGHGPDAVDATGCDHLVAAAQARRQLVHQTGGDVDKVEDVTVERHLTSYSLRRRVVVMSLTIARSTVTTWTSLPASVWLLVVARAVNRLGAFTLPFLSVTLIKEQGAS